MSGPADANNDSDELEALFDQVQSQVQTQVQPQPAPAVRAQAPVADAPRARQPAPARHKPGKAARANDPEDLEMLFDSIVAGSDPQAGSEGTPSHAAAGADAAHEDAVFNRIGHMTRGLHEALRQMGLDRQIGQAASTIPDTRERLKYVVEMTEQAAVKVLNATEAMQPVVTRVGDGAESLLNEWDQLYAGKTDVEGFKALAERTRQYLKGTRDDARVVNGHAMDIVMAQDFQDLTGQVIKKILEVTQQVEKELLSLLIENAPEAVKRENSLLNGPVVSGLENGEVVTSQDQVDDLLESLGF